MTPDLTATADCEVRRVQPYQATKTYLCPGCNRDIPPGTGHVVAIPHDAPDLRRHWHHGCWAASRDPRAPRLTLTRPTSEGRLDHLDGESVRARADHRHVEADLRRPRLRLEEPGRGVAESSLPGDTDRGRAPAEALGTRGS